MLINGHLNPGVAVRCRVTGVGQVVNLRLMNLATCQETGQLVIYETPQFCRNCSKLRAEILLSVQISQQSTQLILGLTLKWSFLAFDKGDLAW